MLARVLSLVMMHLPDVADVASVMLTCKELNRVAEDTLSGCEWLRAHYGIEAVIDCAVDVDDVEKVRSLLPEMSAELRGYALAAAVARGARGIIGVLRGPPPRPHAAAARRPGAVSRGGGG